ncbi:MAG: hypothetical protein HY568_00835 [Candidatus Latescibacteria bacterium]|nr:hypothetical protein [Candidatus Latescibacterota bacterium]
MIAARHHPLIGHAAILAALVLSVGVTRAVYVAPRQREVQAMKGAELRLRAELKDLEAGIQEMEGWSRAHPGQDLWTFHARKAFPARDMVAAFLRSIVPPANRHEVGTELIQPVGTVTDETVADQAGNSMTYRKAELRFRFYASYRNLGEFLREIESMDQLVVVRSISLQYNGTTYPELAADVTIWLYGTP